MFRSKEFLIESQREPSFLCNGTLKQRRRWSVCRQIVSFFIFCSDKVNLWILVFLDLDTEICRIALIAKFCNFVFISLTFFLELECALERARFRRDFLGTRMESEAQNGAHPAAAHPAAAQPEAAKPVNPLRLARPLEKSAGKQVFSDFKSLSLSWNVCVLVHVSYFSR
jgi:hypothetical protein